VLLDRNAVYGWLAEEYFDPGVFAKATRIRACPTIFGVLIYQTPDLTSCEVLELYLSALDPLPLTMSETVTMFQFRVRTPNLRKVRVIAEEPGSLPPSQTALVELLGGVLEGYWFLPGEGGTRQLSISFVNFRPFEICRDIRRVFCCET
jgi:hypothetical protein